MRKVLVYTMTILMASLVMLSCGNKRVANKVGSQEDVAAKKMLQGVWMDEDDGATFFMVKGDTIYYPDSTSLPVAFSIVGDTLFMHGNAKVGYAIVKQTEHFFSFKNQTGDVYELSKAEEVEGRHVFDAKKPVALNQNKLIKRDTVVTYQGKRYHVYSQVNPTTYKVFKSSLNDDGVEVENVYYDNIVHLTVYVDGNRQFSRNFYKKDFADNVPEAVLQQSVLSDITFHKIDEQGVWFNAVVGEPNSPSSYIIEVVVAPNGKHLVRKQ